MKPKTFPDIEGKHYELIVNNVANPIFLKDENHTWVFVNQAFADLYNVDKSEMIGKKDEDFASSKDVERFLRSDLHVLQTGKEITTWDELMFKNNQIYAFITHKKRITGPDGRYYILVSLTNITEQKIIEEELRERHVEISEKNKRIETLLNEIHHRVKNNLQIIISFLNLQSYKIEDKEQRELFAEAKNRIISMSRIHEMLYLSDSFNSLDLNSYLKTLMHDLVQSYAIKEDIRLETNVEKHEFNIDTLIPLGILLNELFSNSIKHAFKLPPRQKNMIKVSIIQGNNHQYLLRYYDNGVGFNPEKIDTENSLGWSIIQSLVEQLEGEIKTNRTSDGQYTDISFNAIE